MPGSAFSGGARRGTALALGIVLLWVAGALLFVAFMSGKVASLTVGTDPKGKPVGPTDLSSLLARIAANVSALQVQSAAPATAQSQGTTTGAPTESAIGGGGG